MRQVPQPPSDSRTWEGPAFRDGIAAYQGVESVPVAGLSLPTLIPARFIRRLSRFSATVDLGGETVAVCVRNSSRMRELLFEGATVWLREAENPHRKTGHDIVLAGEDGGLVVVDAHLPNRLAELWLAVAAGGEFHRGYTGLVREVGYQDSRLDFRLEREGRPLWVEVKSVSLSRHRVAYFPDAPTTRGIRHLRHLAELAQRGDRAAVLFVVQRSDADRLRPNEETDPQFALALRSAAAAGVEIHALRCQVSLSEVRITHRIPVEVGEVSGWVVG